MNRLILSIVDEYESLGVSHKLRLRCPAEKGTHSYSSMELLDSEGNSHFLNDLSSKELEITAVTDDSVSFIVSYLFHPDNKTEEHTLRAGEAGKYISERKVGERVFLTKKTIRYTNRFTLKIKVEKE